ncbi:hypothetical protein PT974_10294 [Cladobotryum mycophilum]|uniref:Nephrocystin 3-like N-terminal domain-containing protein n=1 Tax=Cladobotryum mycophilum TaxID=491253 RepID=A0ABR0S9F9_9HYPO
MSEDTQTRDTPENETGALLCATSEEAAAHATVLNWLTTLDSRPHQEDFLSKRYAGTCQWFLESPEYQTWLSNNEQTLFCTGHRGVGKTILTAVVVDDLGRRFAADPTVGIAYMYYISSLEETLLSLLKQLVSGQSPLPHIVQELYSSHQSTGTRPSLAEIKVALYSVVQKKSRVFIVLDTVDGWHVCNDCPFAVTQELFSMQAECRTNMFATARQASGFTMWFNDCPSFEIRSSDEDMGNYLDSLISQMPVVREDPLLQEEIKSRILKVSDGTFCLTENNFRSLLDISTTSQMRKALDKLEARPNTSKKGSINLYNRIQHQGQNVKGLAKKALTWISHTKDR